jgi:uncharacterized protein
VIDTYQKFIAQVDKLTARLTARYASHLVCRAGCSSCCQHHLSVFGVEAANVQKAIAALPENTRASVAQQAQVVRARELAGEAVSCPLLVDNRCAIYEARPLICRTQGLPLLIEAEDGAQEVDFCPLNFAAPGAVDDLDEDHLAPLDALNLQLAVINLQYERNNETTASDSGARRKIADIILEDTE